MQLALKSLAVHAACSRRKRGLFTATGRSRGLATSLDGPKLLCKAALAGHTSLVSFDGDLRLSLPPGARSVKGERRDACVGEESSELVPL